MNCLTDEQLQLFIDNELEPQIKDLTLLHINTCEECRNRYTAKKEFVEMIRNELNAPVPTGKLIPPFRYKKKPKLHKFVSILLQVAAVLIPTLIVIKYTIGNGTESNFKPSHQDLMRYELNNTNVDANTAYQENMIITTVKDSKGNIINYQLK